MSSKKVGILREGKLSKMLFFGVFSAAWNFKFHLGDQIIIGAKLSWNQMTSIATYSKVVSNHIEVLRISPATHQRIQIVDPMSSK